MLGFICWLYYCFLYKNFSPIPTNDKCYIEFDSIHQCVSNVEKSTQIINLELCNCEKFSIIKTGKKRSITLVFKNKSLDHIISFLSGYIPSHNIQNLILVPLNSYDFSCYKHIREFKEIFPNINIFVINPMSVKKFKDKLIENKIESSSIYRNMEVINLVCLLFSILLFIIIIYARLYLHYIRYYAETNHKNNSIFIPLNYSKSKFSDLTDELKVHDICVICMNNYCDADSVSIFDCKHIFHTSCIDLCFVKNYRNCPLCRQMLFVEHDLV